MSNSTPDDPLEKPRASKVHPGMVQAHATLAATAAMLTDEHFGVFDYEGVFDPSGQEHIVFGRYDVGNNNYVSAVYQIKKLDGTVQEQTFQIGGITSITDHDYVKIDGVRFGKHRVYMTGHKIWDSPDNHLRKMGQIIYPVDVAGWQVFAPFVGQWDDMAGDFKRWAEEVASAGAMSGQSKTHFGAKDYEIRSHIAKIVAVAMEHVGN
jgi:hypothetical protein